MECRRRLGSLLPLLACMLIITFVLTGCYRAAAPGDDTTEPAAQAAELQVEDDPVEEEIENDEEPADPIPGMPDRFLIDSIGVDAHVEHVGKDEEGRMAAPQEWEDVSWFELGVMPGEQGNAVISGHYDSPTGPAVFYELEELELGDQVRVITEEGNELRFEVFEIEFLHVDEISGRKIFGETDDYNLNIVTCGGYWDPGLDMYDHRLVVYTRLVIG